MEEKIYILVVGESIKPYSSLKKLAKSIGIDPKGLKEKLPFTQGSFRVFEAAVDA